MSEKYNGWTNYETWNAALWMGNNDGDHGYWSAEASEYYENAEASKSFTKVEQATLDLSAAMKAQFEDLAEQWMPDQASMFADFINASLSSVNWHEIAETYFSDVEQDAG